MVIESVQGKEPGFFPKPTRRLVEKKPKNDGKPKQLKGMGESPAEMFPKKPRPLAYGDAQAPGRGCP